MASLWYCQVGHGRAEIADAVARQIGTIEAYSCFDPFTNAPADALAERIVDLTPIPDARVFFAGSGSEAVDSAMKLARLAQVQAGHPERRLIISRVRGYHGTNYGGTSAQGLPLNKQGYGELLADVVQVPSDDIEALSVLMAQRSDELCAVITEPVQGAAGVFPPVDGYLAEARRLCDQHGALLIFDEVITGFGRMGTWFAADHYGVTPDMTTFAKGVTSGYQPLGGVIVGRAGSRRTRGRFRLHPPPRLHVLGSPDGLCRRARQPGDHRTRRAPRRSGPARRPPGGRTAGARRRRCGRSRPRRRRHLRGAAPRTPQRDARARPHAGTRRDHQGDRHRHRHVLSAVRDHRRTGRPHRRRPRHRPRRPAQRVTRQAPGVCVSNNPPIGACRRR